MVGLDTCYFSNRNFLGPVAEHELIKVDVRDVEMKLLEGFDAICHLAALSNDPAGELEPGITEDINYRGTLSIAKKAKEAGVGRFVFSGSCSMYGAGDTSCYLTEDAPFNPVTAYGLSKVRAERELSRLADQYFSPVFLRNATACGVSPRLRLDLVVNNLVALAFTTGRVAMTSDGTPWRPIAHVRDICLAFKCAIEAPRPVVHNQAFNIGRNEANYQIVDIAGIVGTFFPESTITFGKKVGEEPDSRTYRVNFEKANQYLPGFSPMYTIEDGAKELAESYQEFSLKEEHLYGEEYITINRYKRLLEAGLIGPDFRWKDPP